MKSNGTKSIHKFFKELSIPVSFNLRECFTSPSVVYQWAYGFCTLIIFINIRITTLIFLDTVDTWMLGGNSEYGSMVNATCLHYLHGEKRLG